MKPILLGSGLAVCALTIAGCGNGSPQTVPVTAPGMEVLDEHHHHHHHEAPNGGTLVEIGDHIAHLEFLLDREANKLTVFAHDGHAENPVRLTVDAIPFTVTTPAGESFTLEATPVANELTGETVGNTSQFHVISSQLDGLTEFQVTMGAFSIRGVDVTGLTFPFPEGHVHH